MKIAVASGKGGTGKTTIAVNMALAVKQNNVELLDCDVEEPNAHLFLKPVFDNSRKVGIPVPDIDYERCSFCGRCSEVCEFNVLAVLNNQVMVLEELCHGCGSCAYFCPEQAIREKIRIIGSIDEGYAGKIKFARGCLNPGEAISPPLINAVKKISTPGAIIIIDAPPGTSCPVVSAVDSCDYCLLVTEPTPFGLHDLDLAYQMAKKLKIPAGVVINRSDTGDAKVEKYCNSADLPILKKIPFNRELAQFYAQGEPVVPCRPYWDNLFEELFNLITEKTGEVYH